uniref:Paramyosin n=1 Tax=Toxocara canis TaxID=6265 RepID=A0A183U9U4_TOXCA
LDETLNGLKSSEERSKKAAADATRLSEELRQEQEHCAHIDRVRKGLEMTIKEMQAKLEDAESAVVKGGQKAIAKMEQRVRATETELENESRRYQDALKTLSKQERRCRELQFQVDEDRKNFDRLNDLIDKLQGKIKLQKKQVDEAVSSHDFSPSHDF